MRHSSFSNVIDNNEVPDEQYPFWLNSGRLVEHFHTRTRTGKIGNNNKYSPTPFMEMNPDVAAEMGILHQTYVRVVSRRSDAVVIHLSVALHHFLLVLRCKAIECHDSSQLNHVSCLIYQTPDLCARRFAA
jgi:predicted molibdopterin-dependent oxidoreductase YjgC